tara:strand:- start:83 stop:283 length:201 start_codon:yes stop_codon:yes gene_type:complete
MIDTDKYETYEWRLQGFRDEVKRLVAENNRLREVLQDIRIDALVMMANGVENAHSIVLQTERGEQE